MRRVTTSHNGHKGSQGPICVHMEQSQAVTNAPKAPAACTWSRHKQSQRLPGPQRRAHGAVTSSHKGSQGPSGVHLEPSQRPSGVHLEPSQAVTKAPKAPAACTWSRHKPSQFDHMQNRYFHFQFFPPTVGFSEGKMLGN